MDKNKLWYFSFGVDHPFGSFLLPIRGTFNAAREVMAEIFGYHWCDQYDDVDFYSRTSCEVRQNGQ